MKDNIMAYIISKVRDIFCFGLDFELITESYNTVLLIGEFDVSGLTVWYQEKVCLPKQSLRAAVLQKTSRDTIN